MTYASTVLCPDKEMINYSDSNDFAKNLGISLNSIKVIDFKLRHLNRKLESHYDYRTERNSKLLIMTVCETLLMISILVLQTIYLKKLIIHCK